jgi:pimeloyl-ACP methyl ester carboxylesterase
MIAALTAQSADTVPPAAAVESPYIIHSGTLELGGTLTLPGGERPYPVVVIIAGSGPTDRNGNSAMGIRPNSYAARVAARRAGIATLRYDKRVTARRGGRLDIAHLSLRTCGRRARRSRSLARDARFSKVFCSDHEALTALLAARNDPAVAGVISVSGLGRPLGVVMREQLSRQVDSATLVRYDTAMAQYLRDETPRDVPPMLAVLFVPVNQSFMKSLAAFDPPAAIRAVRQPVLIVQGGRDLQVRVADAERLHSARPDAQLVVIPAANHVLKQASDTTLMGQLPTYQNPTIPIMAEVVDAAAGWVLKQAR